MSKGPKDIAAMIVALKKPSSPMSKPPSPLSMLLGSKPGDDDESSSDELDSKGLEDAVKRFFEAGKDSDWSAAASAASDIHELCEQYEDDGDDDNVYEDQHSPLPSEDSDSE